MDKNEIEFVLARGLQYMCPHLRKEVTPIDLFDAAQKVWHDIKFEYDYDEDDTIHYHVYRSDLEKILAGYCVEVNYDDGSKVSFVLIEDEKITTKRLENGGILMWYDGDEK